jgi:hypothetical protein
MNKRDNQQHGDSLAVAVEHKGKKAPTEGTSNHFRKLLEGPCPNHAYHVKHAYKDCSHMRRFQSRDSNMWDPNKKPKPLADNTEGKEVPS